MNKLTEKKGGVKRKSFSCESCPSYGSCNKSACADSASEGNAKEVDENV